MHFSQFFLASALTDFSDSACFALETRIKIGTFCSESNIIKNIKILLQLCMIKTDPLPCSQHDLVGVGVY